MTVPGISKNVANLIIAEAGVDMNVFDTAGHLASWAGVCPGQNESAGRMKSTQTRPGDHYLKSCNGNRGAGSVPIENDLSRRLVQ
jgi:transposase